MSQKSTPVLITSSPNGPSSHPLARLAVGSAVGEYNEAFIRDLVLQHPEALPIDEIDLTYSGVIPVCSELSTPAGSIDCLFVNRSGLLTVVECKLWRNPEARRKVIAQILDYARALSRWQYEDLQREVSKRLGISGNALFETARRMHPDLDEAAFVDVVSKNMRRGRFLLLILGDGIREGVEAITDYVQQHTGLQFTLGLVEMPIFACPNGDRFVHPRVLARTTIIERTIVELASNEMRVRPSGSEDAEATSDPTGDFYLQFWGELLSGLRLDAVDQPVPGPGRLGNISFRLPMPGGYNCWITAYRSQSEGEVGVFVSSRQGTVGVEVQEKLRDYKDEINRDLGFDVDWQDGQKTCHFPICSRDYGDLTDLSQRQDVLVWLRGRINAFVNAFRPRVEVIVQEMGL